MSKVVGLRSTSWNNVHSELASHGVAHTSHFEGIGRLLEARHHGAGPEIAQIAAERPAPRIFGISTGERLEGLPPLRPVLQLDGQSHDAVDLSLRGLGRKGEQNVPGPHGIRGRIRVPQRSERIVGERRIRVYGRGEVQFDDLLLELRIQEWAQIEVREQRVLLRGLSKQSVVDPEVRESLYDIRLIGYRVLTGQELDELVDRELVVSDPGHGPIGSRITRSEDRHQSEGCGADGTCYPGKRLGCVHRCHP